MIRLDQARCSLICLSVATLSNSTWRSDVLMYRNMAPNVATQPTPLIDYIKAVPRFTVVMDFWYYYYILLFFILYATLAHIHVLLFYNFVSHCTILHTYRKCIHLHVMCLHYFMFLARTVFCLFHIFVLFSPFYLLVQLTYLVQPL